MYCLASFGTPTCHAQFLIMIFSLFVAKNWRHLTMHMYDAATAPADAASSIAL